MSNKTEISLDWTVKYFLFFSAIAECGPVYLQSQYHIWGEKPLFICQALVAAGLIPLS